MKMMTKAKKVVACVVVVVAVAFVASMHGGAGPGNHCRLGAFAQAEPHGQEGGDGRDHEAQKYAFASSGSEDVDAGDASSCGCGSPSRDRRANGDGSDALSEDDAPLTSCGARDANGESDADASLVLIPGGEFTMGSDKGFFPEDGEGPARKVRLSPFRIGAHEVSNKRFKAFVDATGYITEAEKFGNSFVVEQFVSEAVSAKIDSAVAAAPWWLPVNGSDWAHPEGPDTSLEGRWDHPAIHISWNDAQAFCSWSHARGRLPTEAEWEYAASGGLKSRLFPWGNKFMPKGKHRMNTWQTSLEIPVDKNVFRHSFLPTHDGHAFYMAKNTAEDGYELTAPVTAYEPNAFGLYNTAGNVWEWTSDWHTRDPAHSPTSEVGDDGVIVDPQGPAEGTDKVKKGGSYMCHVFTCYRYRIAARMPLSPDSSAGNVGFRCAADAVDGVSDEGS